jgi:peptidyl-prolyl cis-trans isomerase SurA
MMAAPVHARPRVIEADRIVAIVGSEAITLFDLRSQLQRVAKRLQRQGTPLPPQEALERQMLERMIMERAQIQAAHDQGLRVSDAQLEQTIERIAANNKMSREQFLLALQQEDGISHAQFQEEIRNEMLVTRLREREVDSRIAISDAEIDNFLAQAGGKREELRIAHILLRAPEAASPEQLQRLKARAEDVVNRAQHGENFAELAAAYSDTPDALQGGDLGWRSEDALPALFAKAAKTLRVNAASGKANDIALLQSSNGFHVIKLVARRGDDKEEDGGVRQTRARHILIRVDELISESEAKRRLEDLRERLKHGEDFAELARLYSQDGSAANGGDMGWVNPGDTVPEFERAMDALREGEVSPVIQSPFGFHVIRVEERRVQDMSQEKQRFAARQALRERKLDEAYQDWLRQLRDRTYVEYRLEEE